MVLVERQGVPLGITIGGAAALMGGGANRGLTRAWELRLSQTQVISDVSHIPYPGEESGRRRQETAVEGVAGAREGREFGLALDPIG